MKLRGLANLGYDIVVSFLEKEEEYERELTEEKDLCEKNGLEFVAFPLRDRSVPEYKTFFDTMHYVYRKNIKWEKRCGPLQRWDWKSRDCSMFDSCLKRRKS